MSSIEHSRARPAEGSQRFGAHLLLDMWDCRDELLSNADALVALIRRAAEAAGGTVIDVRSHSFGPWGVTAVALLAESHVSIHTWPEAHYAAVDAYTCGRSMNPASAARVFIDALHPVEVREQTIERGRRDDDAD